MKVISLVMFGVLAVPVLAQQGQPTPKPKEEGKAEQPARQEPGKAAARLLDLVWAREQGLKLQQVQVQLQERAVLDLVKRAEFARAQHVVNLTVPQRAAIGHLTFVAQPQLPANRHVAKVPEADQALLDIQKAAHEGRSAQDLDATLKALDEIERAVMRARAVLHKAKPKTETGRK